MSGSPLILTRTIVAGHAHNQEFTKEAIMIGKGETNDLVINAPGVSSVHALIKYTDNTLCIQDLGSTNGTYVNGQRITGPTIITPRDTVTLGQAEMRAKIKTQPVTTVPVQVAETPAPMKPEATPVQEPPKVTSFSDQVEEEMAQEQPVAHKDRKIPQAQKSDIIPTAQQASDDRPQAASKMLEVSLEWDGQLIAVNHYKPGKTVFVGDDKRADFKIESLPFFGSKNFPFILPINNGFLLQITDNIDISVKNDNSHTVADRQQLHQTNRLAKSPNPSQLPVFGYALQLDDLVKVTVGELTFTIRYVAPAKWVPISFSNSLDFYFSKVIGISLVAHLFLVLALLFTPKMPEGLNDELFQNPDRFANLIIQPPPVKKSKDEFKLEAKIEKARPQTTKTVEKERFGKVEDKKVVASGRKGPAVDLDKRERDQKRALNAGIFSALKGSKGAASVFSGGGLGAGINNAVATLQGPSQEDAGGMGGLGSRGTGGAYGSGGLGIGGIGSGVGGGGGGGGGVGLAGRQKASYSVGGGRTRVEGGLSQAEVAKVLQKAQSQVRYCYEKELQKNPNLDGKIVTIFKIGPNGRVIVANIGAESTLDDANVKSCVLSVIQKLIFPQPRGGGVVDVNYPWLFKRSG